MATLVLLCKRLRAAARLEDLDQADSRQNWPSIVRGLLDEPLTARAAMVMKHIGDAAPVGSIAETTLPEIDTEEPLPIVGGTEMGVLQLVGDASGNGLGHGDGRGLQTELSSRWDRNTGSGDGTGQGMAQGNSDFEYADALGVFSSSGNGDGRGHGDGTGGRGGLSERRRGIRREMNPTRPPR